MRAIDVHEVVWKQSCNQMGQLLYENLLDLLHLLEHSVCILLEQQYFVVQNVLDLIEVMACLYLNYL